MTPFNRIAEGDGCAATREPVPSANGTKDAAGPEASPAAAKERDARGRFAPGNRGGPGNPFARQTAAFRRALCAAVTEDDVTRIAKRLLDMATAGDLAAIKLLLAYVVGRPVETVDPDTLDLEEWRQWSEAPADPDKLVQVITSPEMGTLCQLARAVRPAMTTVLNRGMLDGLDQQAQRDERRKVRKEQRRAQRREAPKANGANGTPPPPPPTANGGNGGPPPDGPPPANGGNGALSNVWPPHLLQLMGAMLGRAFHSRPPDGTSG